METSLLTILVFCLSFASLLYYVFIVRNEVDLGARGKSGLFTILFVILPVLVIALWNQLESKDRLSEIGFNPYPGLFRALVMLLARARIPFGYSQAKVMKNRFCSSIRSARTTKGGLLCLKVKAKSCLKEEAKKSQSMLATVTWFFHYSQEYKEA